MSTDLANTRVWLITGCSSGLGKSLVIAALNSGERVVATMRKTSVFDELSKQYSSDQLLVLPLDVIIPAQVEAVFDAAKEKFGRIDVVVNNAGYGLSGEVEGISDEEARKQIEVLFWGAVTVTKKAVTFFREVNPKGLGGRILQISSAGGFLGQPTLAFYSAGKFALEGFTEGFSKELPESWNIKMTIVEPGGFRTEWAGSSMVRVPMPPVYNDPSFPTYQRREFMKTFQGNGDPDKAAKAMLLVSKSDDPPMRLALGPEAVHFIDRECRQVMAELQKWKEVSESTPFDGAEIGLAELNKRIK